ncbi:MBL fold metallo-hydrolase [Emticicia sp. BO119]|uniref:MBL fold metallo-hydrolase n=1 Tax=Emticicia sp. BO119 TaxID=2757768 RepID=UPI0015F03846|nr:MBL fold metallo-hydrolase [Emticicia sp. BO119]MBA4852015.1 hypothetical protein [Emticicia sp. BO119]
METINSIKIKMFRHGFGDCFLLRFYHQTKLKYKILIDCGLKLHDKVEGVSMSDIVEQIKEDTFIVKNNKKIPHLDALVITHEHWDHVSGFKPEDKLFEGFQIDNLWLGWTEDPKDEVAKQINKRLAEGAIALNFAVEKLKEETAEADTTSMYMGDVLKAVKEDYNRILADIVNFNGEFSAAKKTESGISINKDLKISIDTQRALENVIQNLAKKSVRKYLNPGEIIDNIEQLTGVRIYVLGPPKNKQINKDAPSKGEKKEVYMSLANAQMDGFIKGMLNMEQAGKPTVLDNGEPFSGIEKLQGIQEIEANECVKVMQEKYKSEPWRTVKNDWLDAAGALALQMDSDTNNTSVVLAFEFISSGKVLLFPGDAQVGNWLSWHDYTWKLKDTILGTKSVTATDLLNQTVFYKAGHHASHNATLKKEGLELMNNEELVVFIPEKKGAYPGIPYDKLVERLREKAKERVIFSADVDYDPEEKLKNKPDNIISDKDWKAFKDNVVIDKKFIEYTVKG